MSNVRPSSNSAGKLVTTGHRTVESGLKLLKALREWRRSAHRFYFFFYHFYFTLKILSVPSNDSLSNKTSAEEHLNIFGHDVQVQPLSVLVFRKYFSHFLFRRPPTLCHTPFSTLHVFCCAPSAPLPLFSSLRPFKLAACPLPWDFSPASHATAVKHHAGGEELHPLSTTLFLRLHPFRYMEPLRRANSKSLFPPAYLIKSAPTDLNRWLTAIPQVTGQQCKEKCFKLK